MDAFWAFLIIITVVFFLFVILPSLVTPSAISAHPRQYTPQSSVVQPRPDPISALRVEAQKSRQMLDQYYPAARDSVPEDYPLRPVGSCPYSKPPSTDLPLIDTPMCISVRNDARNLRT